MLNKYIEWETSKYKQYWGFGDYNIEYFVFNLLVYLWLWFEVNQE
jgi:hypothetical protein